jgi:hypothetical protein
MSADSHNIITPEVWGPKIWQALHYISLGYPDKPTEEQKQKYKAFFLLLKDVLPCSICANHYAENLKKVPLTDDVLSSKDNLMKWVISLHNTVNEMKDKPIIPQEQARKMIEMNTMCKHPNIIEKFTETNTPTKMSGIFILILILISLITIAVIYKKN